MKTFAPTALLLLAACGSDPAPAVAPPAAESAAEAEASPAAETPADAYYCPMHPEVTSATEGRCAKCNMFLVKPGDEASHDGHDHGH